MVSFTLRTLVIINNTDLVHTSQVAPENKVAFSDCTHLCSFFCINQQMRPIAAIVPPHHTQVPRLCLGATCLGREIEER